MKFHRQKCECLVFGLDDRPNTRWFLLVHKKVNKNEYFYNKVMENWGLSENAWECQNVSEGARVPPV